jgi:LytS/YehU family sensor histidine kinase
LHVLRHALITMAICCVIAVSLALSTGRPFDLQLAYSLGIGLTTWAVVDGGRLLLRRPGEQFWPGGWRGIVIVPVGIAIGFVVGTTVGDAYCGCSSWSSYGATGQRLLSSIVLSFAVGLGAIYFFYSRGKDKALQARLALIERDAAEARLKLLETQLEPHMLFNTLANLRALIVVSPDAAIDMLDRLNDYLRATLSASRASSHPLAAEFDRLADYLELMKVRMGPRLAYTLELPEALRDCPVPPLLLQPLVENSIKHGLEPKVEGGAIHVRAWRDGDKLMLEVRDTGVGFDAQLAALDTGRGFGVTQVRERLATAYGARARLAFTGAPGEGARSLIDLPCPA